MKIYLKDYDFGEEFAIKFFELVASLDKDEEKEIIFENKDYYFSGDKAIHETMYITNTCSEKEMTPPIRKVGIYLKNTNNITLNGNGAKLWFSDRMTEFVVDNCANVCIKDFIVDFTIPSVYEFDVTKRRLLYVDIKPAKDSPYEITNGKLRFLQDTGTSIVVQERHEKEGYTKRNGSMSWVKNGVFSGQIKAKELGGGIVRIHIPFNGFMPGVRYQVTNVLRDGVGTFINRSKNVTIQNNTYHFMHGLGITTQLTENLTITGCDFTPNYERGRTTATFADIIHCSMCSGVIKVLNCNCDGSRDDILNVHGNHYMISKLDGNKAQLKFCHPQTYGFLGLDKGDEIEFIDIKTLTPIERNVIVDAKMLDLRTTEVTLEKSPSKEVYVGCSLENSTKTASLIVDGVKARHIPTRGFLISTQKPVIVKNCEFNNLYMTNILMSDDAQSWYESGYSRDILIENNKFIGCFVRSLDVFPEAHSAYPRPAVHKNIRVINNTFVLSRNATVARVKRTEGFLFENNKITGKKPIFNIVDSENVKINL